MQESWTTAAAGFGPLEPLTYILHKVGRNGPVVDINGPFGHYYDIQSFHACSVLLVGRGGGMGVWGGRVEKHVT